MHSTRSVSRGGAASDVGGRQYRDRRRIGARGDAAVGDVLIVGCGGIGGVLAAHLLERGVGVTCVVRRRAVREAIAANEGLILQEAGVERRIRGRLHVVSELVQAGPHQTVVLAVPPSEVDALGAHLPSVLAADGIVVCLQNGLCEERVAAWVGAHRVVGAVVAWGASSPAPGVFDRTSRGGFVLGYLDIPADDRLEGVARLLRAVGPVTTTCNLRGARWSKLAINCAVSALGTVARERLGVLLRHRFVRRFALEIISEVVAVARAEGVVLEKVSGTVDLHWLVLEQSERCRSFGSLGLFAKHAVLIGVGSRFRRLRSSMLAQVERGQEAPVDFLNGEVIARAAQHGIDTPFNVALRDAVVAASRGEGTGGLVGLRALYRRLEAAPAVSLPADSRECAPPRNP